jgi:hypothetical protein
MLATRSMRICLLWIGFFSTRLLGQSQISQVVLEVRHDHAFGGCNGMLIMDERGVRYETKHQKHARIWGYEDIKEFQLRQGRRIDLYTYEDRSHWQLGADRVFEFTWSDEAITLQQVYNSLASHTKRPIAASLTPADIGSINFDLSAKHLGVLKGNQGRLQFFDNGIVFRASNDRGSRTWRYEDLESISSGSPEDLTLTSYEQQRFHYASRRVYNFQLKEPLPRDSYDVLWRLVNRKKEQKSSLTGTINSRN